MGAAKALYAKYLKRETEFTDLVRDLRSYYHSLNAMEREEVVEILGSLHEVDAVRELMQLYAECNWRATRFQIIRALSRHPTARSLEFLMSLAKDTSDVPLCEAAIWALGQTHSPQAGRFLVHLNSRCPESILPFVIHALGQVPDHTLRPTMLARMAEAVSANDSLLTRALVSTLGELRCVEALPEILPLLEGRENPALARVALLATGKLSRDPEDLRGFERAFGRDPFAFELLTSVRSQILLRAQWDERDIVARLFRSLHNHKALALELNLHPGHEVRGALSHFTGDEHFRKLAWVLSLLHFEDVPRWYFEFFPPRALSRERIFHVLESVQAHESVAFATYLETIRAKSLRDIRSPLFERWFQAASLCLPHAEDVFVPFMASGAYRDLPTDQKITVINHFVNFALCICADSDHFTAVCGALKSSLLVEELPQVRARLLRAFGQLEWLDDELLAFLRNRMHDVRLASSALFCVERARPPGGLDLCLEVLTEGSNNNQLAHGLLRAAAEQEGTIGPNAALDRFLRRCFIRECPVDLKLLALNFLAKHPRKELLAQVVSFTRAEERLQMAAVVALKGYADETAVDALAECLHSGSESVVGRALDSLTTIPGLRAKVTVLEYLERNVGDLEVCDKVIRCLGPVGAMGVDLSARVERIIVQNPSHPMLDGFFLLKERLNPRSPLALVAHAQGLELERVDERLATALPAYAGFDEELRSVLRAAELPLANPELFAGAIDKSACVVQYCKALDMLLERTWGKERFFPSIERSLHVFQNVVHGAGLGEDAPSPERALRFFGLGTRYSRETLPLAKMSALSQGIILGRVVGDQWKIFDGLRAWAVVLMLFARSSPGLETTITETQRRALPFADIPGEEVLSLTQRLLRMQEIRSLAVHRQTISAVEELSSVRQEALELLATVARLVTHGSAQR